MPEVNGKHYRSFGQGYAAEKASSSQSVQEKPHKEEHGKEGGSIAHVKHHGGGKFSVKHEDGSVTKHESAEDMHQHLDQHFGLHDAPADGDGEGEDMGDGEYGLHSILE